MKETCKAMSMDRLKGISTGKVVVPPKYKMVFRFRYLPKPILHYWTITKLMRSIWFYGISTSPTIHGNVWECLNYAQNSQNPTGC